MTINLLNRIIFSLIVAPLVLFLIFLGNIYFLLLLFITFLCGLYEIKNLKKKNTQLVIFIILIIFVYSCINIQLYENGKLYLFFILILAWLSDIGGYIIGKTIGGKKIGIISKNKTYSGFIGSICFSQFTLIYLSYYKLYFFDLLFMNIIIISFFSALVIIGDLFFSYIKRLNLIKDFSNLMIGHGGLFDRIDGLIFLTIFFNIFIMLL